MTSLPSKLTLFPSDTPQCIPVHTSATPKHLVTEERAAAYIVCATLSRRKEKAETRDDRTDRHSARTGFRVVGRPAPISPSRPVTRFRAGRMRAEGKLKLGEKPPVKED